MEANGSILTNKYSEGLPGARYYGGNEVSRKLVYKSRLTLITAYRHPRKPLSRAFPQSIQPRPQGMGCQRPAIFWIHCQVRLPRLHNTSLTFTQLRRFHRVDQPPGPNHGFGSP